METKDRVSERFLEGLLKFSNFVSAIIILILSFIFFYSKKYIYNKIENISFFLISSLLSLVLIIFFFLLVLKE